MGGHRLTIPVCDGLRRPSRPAYQNAMQCHLCRTFVLASRTFSSIRAKYSNRSIDARAALETGADLATSGMRLCPEHTAPTSTVAESRSCMTRGGVVVGPDQVSACVAGLGDGGQVAGEDRSWSSRPADARRLPVPGPPGTARTGRRRPSPPSGGRSSAEAGVRTSIVHSFPAAREPETDTDLMEPGEQEIGLQVEEDILGTLHRPWSGYVISSADTPNDRRP